MGLSVTVFSVTVLIALTGPASQCYVNLNLHDDDDDDDDDIY